jgi:hypothetical protein
MPNSHCEKTDRSLEWRKRRDHYPAKYPAKCPTMTARKLECVVSRRKGQR